MSAPTERIGRWSPEQRAAKWRREWAVRWLHDEALIPIWDIQRAWPSNNAFNDYTAAGGVGRAWMTTSDVARESDWRRGGEGRAGAKPLGFHVADVRPVTPPTFALDDAVAWLAKEGTEAVRSLEIYSGRRLPTRKVAPHPCRHRGTPAWSMSALDAVHPDLTGARTGSGRGRRPEGSTSRPHCGTCTCWEAA